VFHANDFNTETKDEIEAIESLLKASFQTAFGTLPGNWLQYRTADQHAQINHCALYARAKVIETFGLSISLTNLYRVLSEDEAGQRYQAAVGRENEKKRADSALAIAQSSREFDLQDLEALRNRRLELVKTGLDPDEPEFEANLKHLNDLEQKGGGLLRQPNAPGPNSGEPNPDEQVVDVDRHISGLIDPSTRARELAGQKQRKTLGKSRKASTADRTGQPGRDTPKDS
jgi:hypothetical protein